MYSHSYHRMEPCSNFWPQRNFPNLYKLKRNVPGSGVDNLTLALPAVFSAQGNRFVNSGVDELGDNQAIAAAAAFVDDLHLVARPLSEHVERMPDLLHLHGDHQLLISKALWLPGQPWAAARWVVECILGSRVLTRQIMRQSITCSRASSALMGGRKKVFVRNTSSGSGGAICRQGLF